MKKDIETQKNEIRSLHKKYEEYLELEYSGRNYVLNLGNPDNFVDGIYYHQANSETEKNEIIERGFDSSKVSESNCGAGRGLYLGRDKQALINFYSVCADNPQDFTIKVSGKFRFLNILDGQDYFQNNSNDLEEKVLFMGYDGIRYYDPDATGEEFVLFNIKKAAIWNT